MRMSDAITAYILHRMENEMDGCVELQRNELAYEIGCVPSQISYVLSSRFTPEQGYIVESRRGGGGYIRVRRIQFRSEWSMLTHVINAIGSSVSAPSAKAIIENLHERQVLSSITAQVMSAAVSDKSYNHVPPTQRDSLRADILKQMLTSVMLASNE